MPNSNTSGSDVSTSLAHAIVVSSDAPLLLLDSELAIVTASDAFCAAFNVDCASIVGRKLFDLGRGEWAVRQLDALLSATAAGLADVKGYEFELKRKGSPVRCLVVNAQKLSYGTDQQTRILLAISDVTDARLAEHIRDELLQDKADLYKELQHRVANSLQIVASVLLQSARKVQSDETRAHLSDAHNRVLAIAALQKQLVGSGEATVELKPYFTQLCKTIGASMIRDHDQIHLAVTGDDSKVKAEMSVSLGLVVTELVINALKHAFPDDRFGEINVDYRAVGQEWKLTISDDGVGMGSAPEAGLGTSIVNALARHLQAEVAVDGTPPGMRVSLTHTAGAPQPGTELPEPAV